MNQLHSQNNNASSKAKRIEWVDTGKFFCIMFVMLSHLESGTDGMRSFYTPFFLTSFFFLSGYVYKEPASFKELFYKKVKGLFIPWFIFSHFNILLSQVITLKEHRNLLEQFMWNWLQIRGKDDGLWFVAALFITFFPFYFIIKNNKPHKAIFLSAALSAISIVYTKVTSPDLFPWNSVCLPWHIEYIFQAMLWMVLGYYFKVYGETLFDKYNSIRTCTFSWLVYIAVIFSFDGAYPIWVLIPLGYLKTILGILSLLALCKLLKPNQYIQFVGSNTLTYFGLHGKVFAVLEKLMSVFAGKIYQNILANGLASNVFAVILTIVLSLILIIPAAIINQYFPWVLGRTKAKTAQ